MQGVWAVAVSLLMLAGAEKTLVKSLRETIWHYSLSRNLQL